MTAGESERCPWCQSPTQTRQAGERGPWIVLEAHPVPCWEWDCWHIKAGSGLIDRTRKTQPGIQSYRRHYCRGSRKD